MADDDGSTCSVRLQVGLDDGRTIQEETEATATSYEEVPPFNEEQIALPCSTKRLTRKFHFCEHAHSITRGYLQLLCLR
jgi:hypothetical protein